MPMDPQLRSTLLKLAVPLLTITAVLAIIRFRRIPLREGIGLRWPRASVFAWWLLAWLAWMVLGEVVIAKLGLEQPAPWGPYPPGVFWLRVAMIGLVGPASEELLMRGLAFERLRRTPLRVTGTVIVCAALWAAAHVQYEWSFVAMIFADGLMLGAARAQSGSVLLPFVLHAIGNLYSIWQSTHG
jgi:membrane protease YdiL (CAAX protease family)